MKILTLKRIAENKDTTFGVLLEGQEPICNTVERIWADNKHDESCIPVGEYLAKRTIRPKNGETFEITGVPNRSDILIHKGNTTGQINGIIQTHGCILVGQSFDYVADRRGVAHSDEAFSKLMRWMAGEKEFKLVVVRV